MKTIRLIILLLIIILVGLAFYMSGQKSSQESNLIQSFIQPIQDLKRDMGQSYPKLQQDMDRLITDIRAYIDGMDISKVLASQDSISSSTAKTDEASRSQPDSKQEKMNLSELQKRMQSLAQRLKNMNDAEPVKRLEHILDQLKQQISPADIQDTTESS